MLCRYPFTIITSLVISTISVLLWFSSCSSISVWLLCTLMSNTDRCTLTHMHIHIHTHILAIVCGWTSCHPLCYYATLWLACICICFICFVRYLRLKWCECCILFLLHDHYICVMSVLYFHTHANTHINTFLFLIISFVSRLMWNVCVCNKTSTCCCRYLYMCL